jgi:hypothetical protein
MDPRLLGAFARRGQLMTRRQLAVEGATPGEVDRWTRAGHLVAVRRGVYAPREFWDTLDERHGRPLYAARAASAAMFQPHLMSHSSAALELDLPILRPVAPLIHVTRFGVVGSRTRFGVKHHTAPFVPGQIVFVDGRPLLDHARTVADIAREEGLQAGVVAADSALRTGVPFSALWAAVDTMAYWPHVRTVRAALDLADPGAESVGETLARLMLIELGLGRPETQFGLRDGGREAFCDLRLGRHVFEFDGRVKYRRESAGGVAVTDADEVVWREKKRQDWVCGFKLGMSRIVWADFWGPARERAKQRLLREFLDTRARFGDDVADLAPYVIRGHRRPL